MNEIEQIGSGEVETEVFIVERKPPIKADYNERRIFIGGNCVLRMVVISTCLFGVLVTIISGLVQTSESSSQDIAQRNTTTAPPLVDHIRHPHHLASRNEYFKSVVSKKVRRREKLKSLTPLIQDLEPFIMKLTNVVAKYNEMSKNLSTTYSGVAKCGLNNCGNFPVVVPEKMDPKHISCKKFNKSKGTQKCPDSGKKILFEILGILSNGYTEGQHFEKQFKRLIDFEKLRRFRRHKNNGSRISILREFLNEIKAVMIEILEIQTIGTNTRLNICTEKIPLKIPSPKSPTDLMIREWKIIQQSKKYFRRFREDVLEVVECWEKRERKRDLRRRGDPPATKDPQRKATTPNSVN